MTHPPQNIILDEHNVARFESNKIVEYLVDNSCLNSLHCMGFSSKDWEQLNQLIGYSVSGWGYLSHTSKSQCRKADERVEKLVNNQEKNNVKHA